MRSHATDVAESKVKRLHVQRNRNGERLFMIGIHFSVQMTMQRTLRKESVNHVYHNGTRCFELG